jgi:plasmid stabilization system protein ParE
LDDFTRPAARFVRKLRHKAELLLSSTRSLAKSCDNPSGNLARRGRKRSQTLRHVGQQAAERARVGSSLRRLQINPVEPLLQHWNLLAVQIS